MKKNRWMTSLKLQNLVQHLPNNKFSCPILMLLHAIKCFQKCWNNYRIHYNVLFCVYKYNKKTALTLLFQYSVLLFLLWHPLSNYFHNVLISSCEISMIEQHICVILHCIIKIEFESEKQRWIILWTFQTRKIYNDYQSFIGSILL